MRFDPYGNFVESAAYGLERWTEATTRTVALLCAENHSVLKYRDAICILVVCCLANKHEAETAL